MTTLEQRLQEAMWAAADLVEESPDLFSRVALSVEESRQRRRFRFRVAAGIGAFVLACLLFVAPQTHITKGKLIMRWWLLELITTIVLLALASVLGPLIKRFGKSYAGDVFRANPRTGKSYIVLTDIAYYLIFIAYTLFTTTFELPKNWAANVAGAQLKSEVARVGGILLIIGLLHAANIVMLPMMGRLLSLNQHLDDRSPAGSVARTREPARRDAGGRGQSVPAGSWVLRIEPAPTGTEMSGATPIEVDEPSHEG